MQALENASQRKARLGIVSMLIQGFLSGALLAFATTFAFKMSVGLPSGIDAIVATAIFPAGFAMIVLLGLELATGNFAVMSFGLLRGKLRATALVRNWVWVYFGNFLGCIFVGSLLAFILTDGALSARFIAVAEAKTLAYEHGGLHGWMTALVKGILCNWLVALGTVLGFSTMSSFGKIVSTWLPVSMFFGLALEQSVVNMFLIPTAMALGAGISIEQWLLWNQLPVTLGNILGGAILTGTLLHFGHVNTQTASA
jgi:formate/nitrite transporter